MRDVYGEPRITVQQNQFELVNGTRGRSGRQMDIWSAVFGPLGKDATRAVDRSAHGRIDQGGREGIGQENYDLLHYMQKHWPALGPKIVDKLHIYTGDMDTYHLEKAVMLMEQWMKTTTNPHYPGFFMLRRSQAALLERSRHPGRAPEGNGAVHPPEKAGRRYHSLVVVLWLEPFYLVTEFVEGETLAARLKRGALPTEQVLHYGKEIAQALAAAHARGIIHRDLKPDNVALTPSGAKLLDFGLAGNRH